MPDTEHNDYQKAVLGFNGFNVLVPADDTTGSTPIYHAIQALEDSAITANCSGIADADTSVSLTLLAGQVIMGQFNTVNLTSGKIVCYLQED